MPVCSVLLINCISDRFVYAVNEYQDQWKIHYVKNVFGDVCTLETSISL